MTIKDKQNIIDIAIANYGNIDGVFSIMNENSIGLEPIAVGTELSIPVYEETDKQMLAYFAENDITIATDSSESDVDDSLFASGFWNDDNYWRDYEIWNF